MRIEWTDAHNHLQDTRLGDPGPVIATMQRAGIVRCVVNATCEEDWQAVEHLAVTYRKFIFPAIGIHPWRAHTATDRWQNRLKILLENNPQSSIGECGLDSWISGPSMAIQRTVFMDQLRIGRELDRPVSIHCLKAWGPLFDCLRTSPPPSRFLMHSFGGSIETARRLVSLGAYFSFSGYFLQVKKAAVLDVFRQLPLDRILLESDAPDMLPPPECVLHPLPENHNHPANLPALGQALATALGTKPEALAQLTSENAARCFGFESDGISPGCYPACM